MVRLSIALALAGLTSALAVPKKPYVSPQAITEATVERAAPTEERESAPPLIAKAEALLDRAHFSPGEIDGQDGDNYRRALQAFQQANNLGGAGKLDAATWSALTSGGAAEPVLRYYVISAADVAGPFEKTIP